MIQVFDKNGQVKSAGSGGGGGGAVWGSITGTITAQGDLITYLSSNYYPLSSNPAGYLTSSSLSSYLTIAAAAATYFPIPTGTTSQYLRGDGTLGTFPSFTNTKKNANNSTDSSINYCGIAAGSGVSESSAVWTITKITIATDGTVTTGTANAVAWTNRESVIYT
jgi:hypothetical protein